MTAFANLDRRRVAWCLVVTGLEYRYCAGVDPSTGLTTGRLRDSSSAVVQTPTDVLDAIIDVGPIEGVIDDLKPVAGQSPVEVRIRARECRTAAGVRVHPIHTLGRVTGPPSSTFKAKLSAALEHVPFQTGPVSIQISKSASSLTFPRAFHIGHEVVWSTGYLDAAGLHYITGCTRGADQRPTQEHPLRADLAEQPWVTSDVTFWRGRRADIYVTALDAAGGVIGWETYWSGLIDSPPTDDGEIITLRIAPLTAVMAYKLGVGSAARTASTVKEAHWFRTGEAGVADKLNARVKWNVSTVRLRVTAANGAGGTITLGADGAALLDALGHADDLTYVLDTSGAAEVSAVPTSYASPTLSFGGGATIATNAATEIGLGIPTFLRVAGEFLETFPLRIVDPAGGNDQVVAWPRQLQQVINEAQSWQPGPIDAWDDPDGSGGDTRLARMRLERFGDQWAIRARAADTGYLGQLADGRLSIYRGGRCLRAGWIVGEGVDRVRGVGVAGQGLFHLEGEFDERDERGDDPHEYPHDGPAFWFYEPGEPYVGPFDVDVYTGGTQVIEISGPGQRPVRMAITGVVDDAHPTNGDTVYWYAVAQPESARSIVEMELDAPRTLMVVAGAKDSTPGEYLLRLLVSGVGNADNSAYDAMPIGANLDGGDVSAVTFTRMGVPAPLDGQDYEAQRGKSIEEQTQGLLISMGAQVAQVYTEANDAWRIHLVHMGPADASTSVLTIADSDLVLRGGARPVEREVDGRTVRSYLVRFQPRGAEPVEVPVQCTTERNAAGADDGTPLELDLPGVEVPTTGGQAQAAAEIVADIRSRVGMPRIRWRLAIRADKPGAAAVGLGSVVTLTSEYAVGIDPTETASATPCRVVGIRRDLMENLLQLDLRPFPGVVGGWAQSARVETVVDLNSVIIETGSFSDADIGHFAVNDAVSCIPLGNWSGRTAVTISAINTGTRQIDFSANHGLAVGDIIRCDDYASATTAQKRQAYLASDDEELGSGDPAKLIG